MNTPCREPRAPKRPALVHGPYSATRCGWRVTESTVKDAKRRGPVVRPKVDGTTLTSLSDAAQSPWAATCVWLRGDPVASRRIEIHVHHVRPLGSIGVQGWAGDWLFLGVVGWELFLVLDRAVDGLDGGLKISKGRSKMGARGSCGRHLLGHGPPLAHKALTGLTQRLN